MHSPGDRDRAIERLLEQSTRHASASVTPEDCLDAEILAAWAEGSLGPAEAATIERHIADCARCQTMLATFARTGPAEPGAGAQHSFVFGWHLRWLVPLATAATVAAIWVALPSNQRDANFMRPEISDTLQQTPAEPPSQSIPAPRSSPAPPAPASPKPSTPPASPAARDERVDKDMVSRREQDSIARRGNRALQTPAQERGRAQADEAKPSRQAAAEPLAAGAREERFEAVLATKAVAIEIVSPNSSHRWRLREGRQIEHSIDGGAMWESLALPSADVLNAGHSPAPPVAWLVGRRGAIFVTTDGTRFERVPFIEQIDLVSVVAIDDRQATVTAADGRTFRTSDRGMTWEVGK